MTQKNLTTALAYYKAINDRDLESIEKLYHPEISLLSPLAKVEGKSSALETDSKRIHRSASLWSSC